MRTPQTALTTSLTPQAMLALQRAAGNAAACAVARRHPHDDARARYSFGFDPEAGTTLLGLPEPGCIRHPDTALERTKGYLGQRYWISEHAFDRALVGAVGRSPVSRIG